VTDTNGCTAYASLFLTIDADPVVYIPNVFTPNGDGINDRFMIFANDQVEQIIELEIFNRWGDLVFMNNSFPVNDEAYGWDGNFQARMMNPDVFAYRARILMVDGGIRDYRGDVTLIR
jgi:gliding motility-associated-like protein